MRDHVDSSDEEQDGSAMATAALLAVACYRLKLGGRLVFWLPMPSATEGESSETSELNVRNRLMYIEGLALEIVLKKENIDNATMNSITCDSSNSAASSTGSKLNNGSHSKSGLGLSLASLKEGQLNTLSRWLCVYDKTS